MKTVSPKELKSLLESGVAILIDVREPYELEICKVDAIHIPMAEIASSIDKIDTDKMCVIMCKTGKRAEAVANMIITDHECSNVAVLEGGIIAWIEEIDNHLETY